ncbi:MAG: diguanylate cyclase [Burkholderiales bacterium]|nr:diguanylate cyclase [Burkholderiales bacterium]
MNTKTDHSSPITAIQLDSGFERMLAEKIETRMARFERFGQKLFRVANCFVSFGNLSARFDATGRSIAAMEAAFCDSLPVPEEILVIPDLRNHPQLSAHRLVVGAPYIRFYAAHPIYGQANKLLGCVLLIDYQPHALDDEYRQLLADHAAMIERELALGVVYQMQLELVKQNRNLKRESLIDPLLGTWNKAAIVRSLSMEMERCSKAGKPMALLLASLDQIAGLRDLHGVSLSDLVLVKTVSRIRSCIRPFDALGRFGEDVLLVVLPGASHLVAVAVAERIRLAVMMHPDTIENEETVLTISAGAVSTDIFPDAEPELLISLAEKALLSARSAGNNCVVQATPAQPDILI